jgi:hypothetical protein
MSVLVMLETQKKVKLELNNMSISCLLNNRVPKPEVNLAKVILAKRIETKKNDPNLRN